LRPGRRDRPLPQGRTVTAAGLVPRLGRGASGHGLIRCRARPRRDTADEGNAIIEFIFVAVLVMVPLVYLIITVAVVQRARLAATNAARDVGRAIATSDTLADAPGRAAAALRISLSNERLTPQD